jgi:hypothetical protein
MLCPKCKADTPLGEVCAYCQRRGRRDQLVPLGTTPRTMYSHEECLDRYFAIPQEFKCPDCHIALTGRVAARSFIGERAPVCPECGNANPFKASHKCCDCFVLIYDGLGQHSISMHSI